MATLTQIEIQEIDSKISEIKSKRGRIMEGLRLIFEKSITKANGYTVNLDEATFNVRGWRDRNSYNTPVIYIVDDNQVRSRNAGCGRTYDWTLQVYTHYYGEDLIAFEEFIADVEECIDDNNSIAGQINKMEVENIISDGQFFSSEDTEDHHLAQMTIGITYFRNARNPR